MSGPGSGSVWVGPSECDESRTVREERLREAWSILVRSKRYADMYPVISTSVDLLREALSCYQNGAFMATIIMCGTALESLIYDLVSVVVAKRASGVFCGERGSITRFEYNETIYNERFGCVLGMAKALGLIDNRIEDEINRIREQRNIVAHYSQRLRRLLPRMISSGEYEPTIKRTGWADDENAYSVLKDTARLMKTLIERAYTLLCQEL